MILTLVTDGSAAPEEMLQHEDESGEEIVSEDHDDDDDDAGQEAVSQDPGDHGGSAGVQRVPCLLPGAHQLRLPRHHEN